jgi:tyrosinase
LTNAEQTAFVSAVKRLKETFRPGCDLSVYDQYVHLHMMGMMDGNTHNGPAFLAWHRQFIRNFELELQAIDPNVTIPYWDFTVDSLPTSSLWSPEFLGGTGLEENNYVVMDGPFREGEWILAFDGPSLRRDLGGAFADRLPSPDDVAAALQVPQYDAPPWNNASPIDQSFRCFMQGVNDPSGDAQMHDLVHDWVGGSMVGMASPNDPVFWLMHANLDRIWADWESIWGLTYMPEEGGPPGHNLYDRMYGLGVTPASVLDHHALGYYYDTEQP